MAWEPLPCPQQSRWIVQASLAVSLLPGIHTHHSAQSGTLWASETQRLHDRAKVAQATCMKVYYPKRHNQCTSIRIQSILPPL